MNTSIVQIDSLSDIAHRFPSELDPQDRFTAINRLLKGLHREDETSVEAMRTLLNSGSCILFAACEDRIVGMTVLHRLPDFDGIDGYISDLIVEEPYRANGCSFALVEEALRVARSKGMRKVLSICNTPEMSSFCEHLGFAKSLSADIYVRELTRELV